MRVHLVSHYLVDRSLASRRAALEWRLEERLLAPQGFAAQLCAGADGLAARGAGPHPDPPSVPEAGRVRRPLLPGPALLAPLAGGDRCRRASVGERSPGLPVRKTGPACTNSGTRGGATKPSNG